MTAGMKLPPIGEPPTPRTVLLLGAGASTCLGYPTTADLLAHVEQVATSAPEGSLRSAWEAWAAFRDTGKGARSDNGGTLAEPLLSANPENALSAIDLMEAELDRGEGVAPRELTEARAARNALLQALDRFFVLRHADLGNRPPATRDYLRAFFDNYGMEQGDVVITTNWDAVAELTLAEDGMWNPSDGYGFRRRLESVPSQEGSAGTSPIKVLKLHGSFGWRIGRQGLCLDYHDLLGLLPVRLGSQTVTFRDTTYPAKPGPNAPIISYPSYVKHMRTPELLEVWQLAGEAIRKADTVVAVGYSLPEADLAVRTLLLPLRSRALRKRVKVVVIDRSEHTIRRWQDFLDGSATDMLMNVCDDIVA
jgi:hypothetical protein